MPCPALYSVQTQGAQARFFFRALERGREKTHPDVLYILFFPSVH